MPPFGTVIFRGVFSFWHAQGFGFRMIRNIKS